VSAAGGEDLDRFFTTSLEMLGVAGMDGYFKRLNPAFERTLGFTAEELTARPFIDFVHPDDRQATLDEVAKLASGIDTLSFENRYRCRDGGYVWLSWTTTPVLESGLLYAAARDITERKRAEAEIAELNRALAARNASLEEQNVALQEQWLELQRFVDINRAVLDASVDGIRLVDLEGRTVIANAAIEQLTTEIFGLPHDATLQERSAITDRLADPASYRATMQAISDDAECSTQDRFELQDLGRAFERNTAPVHDSSGTLIGRIIVVREVTAEHEAARLKSELVATVSHELRTPLTGVLGFAELLMHEDVDADSRQRYVQTIHSEAQRLTALVDDFLDLQKIEAGRFTLALEPFELRELLQHQIALFSAQSADHHLTLATPGEAVPMVGDRNRISQVMANLLSNAIKYSPAGGEVTVAASTQHGFSRISVTDSGVGIPAAQQQHVFTKFFRVDSSDTRAIGGTGLGLALCREIVSAHGGRMGFESAEGTGSTFWLELPTAWRGGAGTTRARVLVIEDNPAVTSLLTESLAPDGLDVEHAPTGELGLARAIENPPDVILLDIGLPGELDGWQVLVELKTRRATAHVPVVVCTAHTGRGTATALGASDFLAKPFTGDQLRDTVARLLPSGHGSVLVVDDDDTLRRLVVETLARDGRELREAANGLDALVSIATQRPDVLILDLAMPGLDGFGVLERLRERPETRGLPVVVLTARDLTESDRIRLRERSAWLLEKGDFSGAELRRLVHQALGQHDTWSPARAA
jgi:PAS domain S-box-containing protein